MNKDDMGIVGVGMVGKATADTFEIQDRFDMNPDRGNCTLEKIASHQLIFLCLPTPTVNGRQNNTGIRDLITQIAGYGRRNFFVLRSTVLPGTTKWLYDSTRQQVVHYPEFLSEDTASEDCKSPQLIVVGSDSECEQAKIALVNRICEHVTMKKDIKLMSSKTSEVLKYTMNAYFAMKVTFANTIFDICQDVGANYHQISETIQTHPWVGKNHWDIMHKGYRGFGGSCLPKDLEAINGNFGMPLLKEIQRLNEAKKWK